MVAKSQHVDGAIQSAQQSPFVLGDFPSKSSFPLTRTSGSHEIYLRQRGWTKNRTFTGTIETKTYRSGLVCDQVDIRIDGQEVTFEVRKGLDRQVELAAGY